MPSARSSQFDAWSTWGHRDVRSSTFIAGRWLDGAGDVLIPVVDPTTEDLLATVTSTSLASVEAALEAAKAASDGGVWPGLSGAERGKLLERLADGLQARRSDFVELLIAETGSTRSLAEGLQFDLPVATLRWFSEAAARGPLEGYRQRLDDIAASGSAVSELSYEPIGPVAAITAYNYPLLLLARKIGAILASGCTAVVMPSERAPLTTLAFFHVLDEVGFPPGVANLVVGSKDVGVALTSSPLVEMVSFTGSLTVGEAVMRQASQLAKRVVLELGGKSPSILLPGADRASYVAGSVQRFMMNAGQGCGCTTRLLVHKDDYAGVCEQAREFLAGVQVGDPRLPTTQVGPLIRSEQREFVEGYVDRALAAGAEIVAGGGRPDIERGYFMNPALVGSVGPDDEIAQEELFGPVGVILPYAEIDEAIEIANNSKYGLNAFVWGPPDVARSVARRVRAGTVGINGGGGARPDVPWGGFRGSGLGREGGEAGFLEYFEVKHIQEPAQNGQ